MSNKAIIEQGLKVIGLPYKGSDPNGSYIQQWDADLIEFSKNIEKYYEDNRQTDGEFAKKLQILKEIEDYLIKQVFNKQINRRSYEIKAVVPFGSSNSGLGMKGGDLDLIICVYPPLPQGYEVEMKRRTNDILTVIHEKIKSKEMLRNRRFEDLEHREKARVPIVTGKVDGIDLDISISMTQLVCAQYLSSKYIDAYEKYDRRFILLAAFVKEWQNSEKEGKDDEYCRAVFPNSCSTVLLVTFFMKYYNLLPHVTTKHNGSSLTEEVCGTNECFRSPWGGVCNMGKKVNNWKRSNFCQVSVGTLFLLFLHFYTNVIDFKTQRLEMERATAKPKSGNDAPNQIVIEDVIDKQNPAGSVTDIDAYKQYLQKALKIIKTVKGKDIFDRLLGED
ncbi:hypothetical protein GCK72_001593 [Caenorhabditis remanei]|uniref:Poly(A) RNA polymerase mitochondrial-like central palm domain-containing protein n=1 Tax=Caenorhabditis remanei TaxID=31234 RepID=A0A6A5HSR7_CAERE|nr:hypothetical protein GCK72_001593 [Caenorhabditis remanei]KAF1769776.1 hypothetical protein GCK72_001593 [Caenorhabditis remanei]